RAVGNTLYLFATDGQGSGNKLFKSDGSLGNAVLVKDVAPGIDDWYFDGLGAVGNKLLFGRAYGDDEPWVSDGTPDGTFQLADINPGPTGSSPTSFLELNGFAIFTATVAGRDQLWRTDGTPAGTVLLKDIAPVYNSGPAGSNFHRVGNQAYF